MLPFIVRTCSLIAIPYILHFLLQHCAGTSCTPRYQLRRRRQPNSWRKRMSSSTSSMALGIRETGSGLFGPTIYPTRWQYVSVISYYQHHLISCVRMCTRSNAQDSWYDFKLKSPTSVCHVFATEVDYRPPTVKRKRRNTDIGKKVSSGVRQCLLFLTQT